jgi:hypothetical protein
MVGVSLPTGYNLRTHVRLSDAPEGCVSVITHTFHCIQLMSAIKNAYVCVVNGEPELFETQQQAEDHAMELSFAWYDANLDVPAPRLAVMSVTNWLQLQSRLALV